MTEADAEVLPVGDSFSDPNVRWIWTKLGDLGVRPVGGFLEIGASSDRATGR